MQREIPGVCFKPIPSAGSEQMSGEIIAMTGVQEESSKRGRSPALSEDLAALQEYPMQI